ncbi:putative tetratricopeptide-like helical domain superfamily [Dioscorea sansibarensis]
MQHIATLKSALLNLLHEPTSISSKSFNQIHALLLTSPISIDYSFSLKLSQLLASFPPSFAHQALKRLNHHQSAPFLFNTLISSYARTNTPLSAFLVYRFMLREGFRPDKYTFPVVLKSCMSFSRIGEARQVHGAIVKMGFAWHLHALNALVHVYGLCGEFDNAGTLFDEMPLRDVVSWTGLISVYVKAGFFQEALALFGLMDVEPNGATLVSVLVACGRLGELKLGRRIHGLILKRETGISVVEGNALMDMYVKCEHLDEAKRVFEGLPLRDIVSWTSIISGFAQCKRPKDALEVFHAMQGEGLEPDKVTLSSVLSACASLGALDTGNWVCEYIERKGLEWDVHIGTSMVDMYAKCGCLEMALQTFRKMPHKNVSSWNALIGGLALHGHGSNALYYFDLLIRSGIKPNDVTFVAILSACSHSGFVEEGRRHFNSMSEIYQLAPKIEHYGCMVDLLGRAGLITEAYELIRVMPLRADVRIWGAMLSACKAHGNVELSQQILGRLLELESCDSGMYVLLSNIFANSDRWGDVNRMRKLMRDMGIKKEPGSSVIEVNGKAHEFLVGEIGHPEKAEILLLLYVLAKQVQMDI